MTAGTAHWYDTEPNPDVRSLLSQLDSGQLTPGFASDIAAQFTHSEFYPNQNVAAVRFGLPAQRFLLPTMGGDPSMIVTPGYSDSPGTDHSFTPAEGKAFGELTAEYPYQPPHDNFNFWTDEFPQLAGVVAGAFAPAISAYAGAAEGASAVAVTATDTASSAYTGAAVAADAASTGATVADGIDISTSDLGGFGSSGAVDYSAPAFADYAGGYTGPGAALPDVPGSVTAPATSLAPAPAPGASLPDFFSANNPYNTALTAAVKTFGPSVLQSLTAKPSPSMYVGTSDPYLRAAEATQLSQGDLATLLAQSDRAMISTAAPNLAGVDPTTVPRASNNGGLMLAGLGLVLLVFMKGRA